MFSCMGADYTGAVGKMPRNLRHIHGKHIIVPQYDSTQSSDIIRNQQRMIFETISYSKLVKIVSAWSVFAAKNSPKEKAFSAGALPQPLGLESLSCTLGRLVSWEQEHPLSISSYTPFNILIVGAFHHSALVLIIINQRLSCVASSCHSLIINTCCTD